MPLWFYGISFAGVIALAAYIYYGVGSPNYDRNYILGHFVLAVFFCLGMFIHNFNARIKPYEYPPPEREITSAKKVSRIPQITTVTGVILRKTIWVKTPDDVDELVAAVKRKDVAYLDQMIYDGRAFYVFADTRVYRSESGLYEGVVFITFLEGQYTNQRGYTFAKCVPLEDDYLSGKGMTRIPDSHGQ